MRDKIVILVLGVLLCYGGLSRADIVSLDLFSLGCPTEFNNNSPSWQTNFDLGVTFTQISHVYIDWSGEITAGLQTYMGSGVSTPLEEGVGAYIGTSPNHRYTGVLGGGTTYPVPEPFDQLSELVSGIMPWSELFDGQGTIRIARRGVGGIPEIIILQRGSTALNSATLIIDGTVAPEPCTFALFGFALPILRAFSRRKI
ncbi:MAG: hypothetical protein WC770_07615 [Phycisphaerae bacterium]|jgi:hypothetical protein